MLMGLGDIADRAVTEFAAMQKPRELEDLLQILAPLGLDSVLEIGGMYGGTMWAWMQVCAGPYTCIDKQVLEGRMESVHGLDCQTILGDSTSAELAFRMADQRYDFIFIDGDHTFEAVSKDAVNWLPLLSDKGVAAFHDICHRRMRDHDMWRFWQNLKRDHPDRVFYDIYDPSQTWGGIGVMMPERVRITHLDHTQDQIEKPPQCEDPTCECCGIVLNLEHGEEVLCVRCAQIPAAAR